MKHGEWRNEMKNRKGWNIEIKVREKHIYKKDRERRREMGGENS